MDTLLPRYMNMRQMATMLGMTKHSFRRLFDKHQLPHIKQGRDNLLDTKLTLLTLAKVPGIEYLISAQGVLVLQKAKNGKLDYSAATDWRQSYDG